MMRLSENIQLIILNLRRTTGLNLSAIAKESGTSRGSVQRLCELHGLGNMGRRRTRRILFLKAPKQLPKLTTREAGIRLVVRGYRQSAKSRGIQFDLSDNDCRTLLAGNCYYCGADPQSRDFSARRQGGLTINLNGIDRLDSSSGYALHNCVSCCKMCNLAKRDFSLEEFMSWTERLLKYRQSIR